MPAPLLSIEIDKTAIVDALTRLGDRAAAHVKAAAKETATAIARDAGQRIARRTGFLAQGITVEETHNGEGYVVYVNTRGSERRTDRATGYHWSNLDIGLEFGTPTMRARPFMLPSVDLERGPHDRRIAEAVQDAIDESGLGE